MLEQYSNLLVRRISNCRPGGYWTSHHLCPGSRPASSPPGTLTYSVKSGIRCQVDDEFLAFSRQRPFYTDAAFLVPGVEGWRPLVSMVTQNRAPLVVAAE